MDLSLNGRRALVCASTDGLGLAVARALAAEGVQVVISGRRGERARALAEEITALGGGAAVGVEADLGRPEGAEALYACAVDLVGEIDILVLNGPGPAAGEAASSSWTQAEEALHLLLRPHFDLLQAAVPGMRERGWGRVLAIGSSGVAAPLPNLALSNLGRSALAGFLKTLAAEVASDGVTVNLLLPGRIATDRVAWLDQTMADRQNLPVEEVAARSQATIPAGRYGRPEEFGAVAAFLCSGPASYVTGTSMRCDGGLVRGL